MNEKRAGLLNRIAGGPPKRRAVVGLALGVLIAAGQSPVSLPIVALLALTIAVGIFFLLDRSKQSAWFGWFIGVGYFGASLFWMVEPFLVEPERHAWMAPFAIVFLAGGLALFWAFGFGLAHRVGRGGRGRIAILALTLTLAELARSYVLTGFPWGLIGYIWLETPVIQLAAIISPHGLGFLTLVIAVLPWFLKHRYLGFSLAIGILIMAWGGGLHRLSIEDTPREQVTNLRLIQPNAEQHEKWDPELAPIFFQRQLDLTATKSETTPDLIIWPEAAVSWWLDDLPDLQAQIVRAAPSGATVIIGARRLEERRFFNSMVRLGADGLAQDVYDKVHLAPFGEYIPFGGYFSRFGIHGLAADEGGGFTVGTEQRLMDLGQHGQILPLICYEAIFPQMANFSHPRPDWILQITNDAWFGKLAGPQQHLAQARVRAIEQGLPLVRVGNTGISAIIDSRGRMVAHLPLGAAGKLDGVLPGSLAPTLYSKTGDWLILVLLLIGTGAVLVKKRQIY